MVFVALFLSLALVPARHQEPNDTVTGTWEAHLTGDSDRLPPEGVTVVLGFERVDDVKVRASLEMNRTRVEGIEADFDEETGELSFRANFLGILVDAELVIDGDRLSGTFTGLGVNADLKGRRIRRELPAASEPAPAQPVDCSKLTPEDWHTDLGVLAARLPALHKNAFHSITPDDWARLVRELDERLQDLDTRATAIAFAQLVARIGDAHTDLGWRALPLWSSLPLRLFLFSDGLFVIAAAEDYADMLGARVLRIGGLSVEEAMDRAATTFAAENDAWRRHGLPARLTIPELLLALGVTSSAEAVPFTLEEAPGTTFETVVRPATGRPLLRAPDPASEPLPLWLQHTGDAYWHRVLPEAGAVYFAYNRCAEDPRRPMGAFIEELLRAVETSDAHRLVIDLRHNSGGNSVVLSSRIPALLEHPNLRAPGAVVALIGPRTYSSGMMNAAQLRAAGAVLLGEPTGGRPNSYGEVRSFRLPRSGLQVYYSTKLFRLVDDDPPSVLPDEEIRLTSFDWFSGRDPVLERALER